MHKALVMGLRAILFPQFVNYTCTHISKYKKLFYKIKDKTNRFTGSLFTAWFIFLFIFFSNRFCCAELADIHILCLIFTETGEPALSEAPEEVVLVL